MTDDKRRSSVPHRYNGDHFPKGVFMNRLRWSGVLVCVGWLIAADATLWKVTPAAPASIERDRVIDLTARRQAVAGQIGEKGILILHAAQARNYAGDVDWPYRQENDFFYLTEIPQAGSTLVIVPGGAKVREILFMPPSDPAQENWTGHILTPEEGRKISGIQDVWDARQFNSFLTTLIPQATEALPPAGGGRGGRGGRGGQAPPAIPVDVGSEFAKTIAAVAGQTAQLFMLT